MSKITIPLLMIFAAVGFFALAKLDRDGRAGSKHMWPGPGKSQPPTATTPVEDEIVPLELPASLTGAEFERETNRELDNIRLLQTSAQLSAVSFLWPGEPDGSPAQPGLLEFAQRASFERWKSFTDERLGFFYPDAAGVRVEEITNIDSIPLLGETLLPPRAEKLKCYRLTAGDGGTMCVIILAEADQFDDRPRGPHPETFHRFTSSGGGLLRTSFTAQGQVRRAELLGLGVRVTLLDWPHLAIHPDVYLRIAAGIELQQPHANFDDLREAAIAKYGFAGMLGCLDHGMPESEVISITGGPDLREQEPAALRFHRREGLENVIYRIPIRLGLFVGFGDDWREEVRRAPQEGSLRWMFEKTDFRAGEVGCAGYSLGELTDQEAEMIFDRVVELAPSASPDDWETVSGIVVNLSQHGLRDQRLTDIAREKLEAMPSDPQPALLILQACDSELSKAAIIEYMVATFDSGSPDPTKLELFYTLISYLGRDFVGTRRAIDQALNHESPQVRELGLKYCAWLPEKYALPHLEAGLRHGSAEVRRRCANAFATGLGTKGHARMLEISLSEETDDQAKALLELAIRRLGAR